MTDKNKRKKHLWLVEDVPNTGNEKQPRSFWTKIGIAFENNDGSWSLHFAAFPVSGKVQMRDIVEPLTPPKPTEKQ